MIGKFPPIQGGVSMRTCLTARVLAARGHDVHVITNAREVAPPFRMHMRPQDWDHAAPRFDRGAVTVHWTDPVDRSQTYIPMASPFVSKLATLAAAAHASSPFDVLFSHYMEPYGVAGYLASQMTGLPHVVRMAGSDAGRLWHHPQLETLYDHVLRSAAAVVAVGPVAERAANRGVDPTRIVAGGGFALPEDAFTPKGPVLDIGALRAEASADDSLRELVWGGFSGERPHFGVYGKLGDTKGTFALLAALHRLKTEGLDVGLVALAHGRPEIESRFRDRVVELGLADRVLQLPFVPHWRVPDFLRGCLAVCCLEQDFPIGFHSPIIPMEVLLCGSCLVASTELIRKLPQWERLPHGYGCVAVGNVNDIGELGARLAAIVREPEHAAVVGARGRRFALERQRGADFAERLERILEAASQHRPPLAKATPRNTPKQETAEPDRFPLTRMAAAALKGTRTVNGSHDAAEDLAFARKVLSRLQKPDAADGDRVESLTRAVRLEIALAEATSSDAAPDPQSDPLFRLQTRRWALAEGEVGEALPIRNAGIRLLQFDYEVAELQNVGSLAELPRRLGRGPSYMVVFAHDPEREPLLVDGFTARILELSDGTRSSSEIIRQLDHEFGNDRSLNHLAWIEDLFLSGLLSLKSPAFAG